MSVQIETVDLSTAFQKYSNVFTTETKDTEIGTVFFRLPVDDGKRKSLCRRRRCRFSCPSVSPDGQESRGNLCALW